jgi:hypothetical protein
MNFLALDGESINDNLCLLGSNTDLELRCHSSRWLSTAELVDFLWSLRWKSKGSTFVWFSAHYDVNHIARDLSQGGKDALFNSEPVVFKGYKLHYFTRKFLRIKKLDSNESAVTIYDVWSFFGSSFIKACEKFLVNDAQWKEHQEKIEWGKKARVAFQQRDFEEMREYNLAECQLLVKMMNNIEGMLTRNDLSLSRWYGPSALAGTILRSNDIQLEYPDETEWLEDYPQLREPFYCAYFGGRIEAFQLGSFRKVYYYDINSAYPTALSQVWRVSENWEHHKKYSNLFASVWHIRWKLPKTCHIGLFPFRDSTGSIYFPSAGEGWYWQPEIEYALKYWKPYITVLEGYSQRQRKSKMTELVLALYKKRQQLKAIKDDSEYVLKIALNSMYGKFAQRLGKAPYRNLCWAGYTTSYTRARLLEASHKNPKNIIAFATDGIISTALIKGLKFSKELGDWSADTWKKAAVLMPGIYFLENDEDVKTGIRGFKNLVWLEVLRDMNSKHCKAPGCILKASHSHTNQKIFVSHKLATMQPEAFGKDYLGFVDFDRAIQPKNLDKRIYHFSQIKDWERDHCDSEIRSYISKECSAPIKGFSDQSWEQEIWYEEDCE